MHGSDDPEDADSTAPPRCRCLLDRHSMLSKSFVKKLIWTRVTKH